MRRYKVIVKNMKKILEPFKIDFNLSKWYFPKKIALCY